MNTPAKAQREAALANANHIRIWRAQLRRDIAAGRVNIDDVVLDPPELARGMKISKVFSAVRYVGPGKVVQMCVAAGGDLPLEALAPERRAALLMSLPARARGGE